MADINVYGNLHLASGSMSFEGVGSFPASPRLGRLALVSGVLYIYSSVQGVETWYPLTNQKNVYVHIQGAPALTWTIVHNLASTDLIYMVYDENGTVQLVDADFPDSNTLTLDFSEATAGKAVLFVATEEFLPAITSNRLEVGNVIIEGSAITVEGTDIVNQIANKADDVDWTVINNNYTATDGEKLMVDTRSAPLTISLPATPAVGEEIQFADMYANFDVNPLTVGRNGQTIAGESSDFIADLKNAPFSMVFFGGARGWVPII